MTTQSRFQLTIVDMFRFADGRTVLVGSVEDGPPFIPRCRCNLFVGDTRRGVVELEGEMMPDRRRSEEFRSVSTKDAINLELEEVRAGHCRLQQAEEI